MPKTDRDEIPEITPEEQLAAGINVAIAFGATALVGVMAIAQELRSTIGDGGVDRVREKMLARLTGTTSLPDVLRHAIEKEVLEGTAKSR